MYFFGTLYILHETIIGVIDISNISYICIYDIIIDYEFQEIPALNTSTQVSAFGSYSPTKQISKGETSNRH